MEIDTKGNKFEPSRDSLDELLRLAYWPDESDDPIDQLLATAQWPDLPAQALTPSQSGARRAYVVALAVTASIVAFAVWGFTPSGMRHTRREVEDRLPQAKGRNTAANGQSNRISVLPIRNASPSLVHPRLHTTQRLEELRFQTILVRNLQGVSSEIDKTLVTFLSRREALPGEDLEPIIEKLRGDRTQIERRLMDYSARLSGRQQVAAIELLSAIGSEASVPLLLRLRLKESTREPALRAIIKLADVKTLSRLWRSEPDPTLRSDILEAIHARADQQTLFFTLATEGKSVCRKHGWD